MDVTFGIIGGSDLYDIDGLERAAWVEVASPSGAPSESILTGTLGRIKMAVVPPHGQAL